LLVFRPDSSFPKENEFGVIKLLDDQIQFFKTSATTTP
jgi:hypothetical protein